MNKTNKNSPEELLDSEDWNIRIKSEKEGYGLDKLVNDKDWRVRLEVACQGYGLDKLINDKYWEIRREVARQGYGLEELVNDKSWKVRLEIVRQGYGLEKLINDEDWGIRLEVARQGYGLDKLVNDKNEFVRDEAKYLTGSRIEILSREFGKHKGLLYLRIWKDKYEIESCCYKSSSIHEWHKKCTEQINKETADFYSEKVKELINI